MKPTFRLNPCRVLLLGVLFAGLPAYSATTDSTDDTSQGTPPGAPPGGEETSTTTQVSATEGNWSFDVITTTSGDTKTVTSTLTYYAGKSDSVVIVPSVLGGAPVTKLASQAFGHHSEIAAVYVPDTVTDVSDWAFYDLNTAAIISFANPDVVIDDAAFQSSGNAALYLPSSTTQTSAGGKSVVTTGSEAISVTLTNSTAAAIAGGNYLNVTTPSGYELTTSAITAIAESASHESDDVAVDGSSVTFSGADYVAEAQVVEIYSGFESTVTEDELSKTFRSLTAADAETLNTAIAADSSYSEVKSKLQFAAGYYLNGNPVTVDDAAVAYDVKTGESVSADSTSGLFPSTGSGYYKYVTWRDTDSDGDIDTLYYSPYTISYAYNSTSIVSDNDNLNGLSARNILNPVYLSFANAVVKADGESDAVTKTVLFADTDKDGEPLEAAINEERSVLWATNYGSVTVDELHANSTSVGNWAKMSYESGLSTYNNEIVMEWGMNALLYATNGGAITVGSLTGPRSTLSATGDGANGIIAGASGTDTETGSAPFDTSSVKLYNADMNLQGWNNHAADVVYGGYAYLEDVNAITGIYGSYAVGQASALANDFGNGVVEVKNFHTRVYGNRSAGAYVIGGGIITAENSSFVSRMDAGVVSASGGTFSMKNSQISGQIGFRNRGGINSSSTSTFTKVSFQASNNSFGYVTGETAAKAVAAWETASGGAELMHYMMSDPEMTLGQLCDHYDVTADAQSTLLQTLSQLAGRHYTANTPLRSSVLDNTYYNYSAGQYTGSTDFSDVPYLTVGSSYGGLTSSVFEFEASGINLELNQCKAENLNRKDYRYLVSSEAGSSPVITFNQSRVSGVVWNEGDVTRAVEGRSSARSSAMSVTFNSTMFTGSFADGSNGLWNVESLSYTDGNGDDSSLNGNYYGATANWGISASFDASSSWLIQHDSYLGKLTLADSATIQAPVGYTVQMTVNGEATDIEAGTYSGEVVLTLVQQ
ncbi:hypothetical protein VA7868_00870 [Vibrio aerogenes CECT 7868]|uniref:Uncharacterized protein n=1 Tax=Vibrio aerogenes CECT 7868 TaxID=1216006 RepID=A0A1M5WUC8_9VIBR|nr:hypothetical protein [Vibrio aerogenes]SHH91050.1 hypothetical protein VA7868_00870 [Vibrio aerogenes CECT 7868]